MLPCNICKICTGIRTGGTKVLAMYSFTYSSIINVLVLVLIHHQCTRTRTHPSSMYSYSYSSIINVLVLVLIHHQCTRTRTHPSSMYSYSYSSIINVLVLLLTHHQCTRTRTHPSSIYSYSYSPIINVLVLVLITMYFAPGLIHSYFTMLIITMINWHLQYYVICDSICTSYHCTT